MRVRAIDKNGDWTFGHSRNNYKTGIEAVKQLVTTFCLTASIPVL